MCFSTVIYVILLSLNHFISSSCVKGKLAKIEPSPALQILALAHHAWLLSPTLVYKYCHDRFTFYTVAVFIAWIKMPWYSRIIKFDAFTRSAV